jgi:hypothetical protein
MPSSVTSGRGSRKWDAGGRASTAATVSTTGGVSSADRILPTLQRVDVGDLFPWTPTADDGFIVRSVEHGRALVLGGAAGSLYRVTWAFVLERIDDMSTRLLTRASAEYTHLAVAPWLSFIMRPLHFGMQQKQLLNLKASVEASGGPR